MTVPVTLSTFARNLNVETAFTVLAVARTLKAQGKDVVELEIGDSPFESTAAAKSAGAQAIRDNQSHYCPSPGLPAFREEAAKFVRDEFGIPARPVPSQSRERRSPNMLSIDRSPVGEISCQRVHDKVRNPICQ